MLMASYIVQLQEPIPVMQFVVLFEPPVTVVPS